MSNFATFAALVHDQFNSMSQHGLFVTASGDEMWDAYLAAFPAGTNELYRERTEHDCSCCRHFIKNIGNVVAIISGKVVSVWDVKGAPAPYDVVAKALHEKAINHPITNLFRTSEAKYGAEHNFEKLEDGGAKKWRHFWGEVNIKHRTGQPDKARGDYRTKVQTLQRGLDELKLEALQTVLELIEAKTLYRGEEHKCALLDFRNLYLGYYQITSNATRNRFVWSNAGGPAAHFRNSVMGTLVQDLSEGKGLEYAVKAFETKVAPANYKRTTALVTPRMVEEAMKTIRILDLEPALDRRHAKLSDVSVTDVLWVSSEARSVMKGGLEAALLGAATAKTKAGSKATEITADALLADVLPKAKKLELFVANEHQGNFMSITAPGQEDSPRLFKWNNGFAWSYDGEVTDSIKERVKKAGGSIVGDLCCRLAWDYEDDLDFYMYEPGGSRIFFSNRRQTSPNGGMLDVDANGIDGIRPDPVENIFYRDATKMRDGTYELKVHNYCRRSSGTGLEVEIEAGGEIHSLSYNQVLRTATMMAVASVKVKGGRVIEITPNPDLRHGRRSSEKWGVSTETFIEVDTLMFSPNHWGGDGIGNKHWFFLSRQIRNPNPCRGLYNEFLRGDLEQHRKVFELIGEKTKVSPDGEQLSGLGFSSTRKDKVTVRADGRLYNVQF